MVSTNVLLEELKRNATSINGAEDPRNVKRPICDYLVRSGILANAVRFVAVSMWV